MLQERHPGLGETHRAYKQVKAAKGHEGEVYVVCDCQGIVVALQNADYKTKFRKQIKGAYWNYHLLILCCIRGNPDVPLMPGPLIGPLISECTSDIRGYL